MADGRWTEGGAVPGEKLYRFFTVFAGEKLSALTKLDYACRNRAEFYRAETRWKLEGSLTTDGHR
jgi:hypothetical protein